MDLSHGGNGIRASRTPRKQKKLGRGKRGQTYIHTQRERELIKRIKGMEMQVHVCDYQPFWGEGGFPSVASLLLLF